jgi:hypothetical protein
MTSRDFHGRHGLGVVTALRGGWCAAREEARRPERLDMGDRDWGKEMVTLTVRVQVVLREGGVDELMVKRDGRLGLWVLIRKRKKISDFV